VELVLEKSGERGSVEKRLKSGIKKAGVSQILKASSGG
jgi:hypothetical protein